jgi:hypothetical protein
LEAMLLYTRYHSFTFRCFYLWIFWYLCSFANIIDSLQLHIYHGKRRKTWSTRNCTKTSLRNDHANDLWTTILNLTRIYERWCGV